jgi:hypothetical protein
MAVHCDVKDRFFVVANTFASGGVAWKNIPGAPVGGSVKFIATEKSFFCQRGKAYYLHEGAEYVRYQPRKGLWVFENRSAIQADMI